MNVGRTVGFTLGAFVVVALASAQGPDDKGAVLRSFLDEPAIAKPKPAPRVDSPNPTAAPADPIAAPDPSVRRGLHFEDVPDINRDIQVTPAAGNWLIMVISYPGNAGAELARKMCLEIRTKNRVPAYVFVFGAEERRKEYERVKKIVEQQQAFFKQNNLLPDQPVRIRHQQIEVHHAVLIGGYPDDKAANDALASVRSWPQPDENKVQLEVKYYRLPDPKDPSKSQKTEAYYVNPFKRAFVCRNPTVKQEAPEPKLDVAALKRLNADEPYSLFHCKKPFTLAVKEWQTAYMMHDRDTPASIWDTLAGVGKADRPDGAKLSAHNLAETLRKANLGEAYVLHAKFSSTVTIGAFDGPDDPLLKATQEKLADRFARPPFNQIQFFHRPVPMAVPR